MRRKAQVLVSLIVFHVGLLIAATGIFASLFVLPPHFKLAFAAISILFGSFLMFMGYRIGKR